MATTTPNLGLTKPTVGADSDAWGNQINASLDTLDAKVLDKTTGGTVTGPLSVTGALSGNTLSGAGTGLTGTAANLTAGSANSAAGGQFSHRNRIINGDISIFQRGTSGAFANTYSIDRWIAFFAGTAPTWSVATGGALLNEYFPNLYSISGAAGNTGVTVSQRIESKNSADLSGRVVTFSAYVFHTGTGGARSIAIMAQRPNAVDNWSGVTSIGASATTVQPNTWTRITWTTTLPSTGVDLGLSFELGFGSVTAGQVCYFVGAQLEAGSVATPFEHRPVGVELALCQRYYYAFTGVGGTGVRVYNNGSATSALVFNYPFKQTMRTTPSVFSGTYDLNDGATTNLPASTVFADGFSTVINGVPAGNFIDLQSFAASAEL